jgi:hypothetical protein
MVSTLNLGEPGIEPRDQLLYVADTFLDLLTKEECSYFSACSIEPVCSSSKNEDVATLYLRAYKLIIACRPVTYFV